MTIAADYLAAIRSPTTRVYRRVDIYEADGTTLRNSGVPFVSGSVNVDQTRDERRSLDIEFSNNDGLLDNYPGGFWYDKVIKPFRGLTLGDVTYETPLGEFVIDRIETGNGAPRVRVTARDYTKKCLVSKFTAATSFAAGQTYEAVIKAIAQNAGITKFNFPVTGKTLANPAPFDRGYERWRAMNDLALAIGYELFFDASGYLVLREQRDPTTAPITFTFQTGAGVSNIASYRKSTTDTRIYNHVAVTGEREGQLPVFAEALNTEPSSPTRIAALGDRVYEYVSSFISTTLQAQDVADKFLKVHALESYEIDLTTLVIPWLEAGDIIEFIDPNPNPGDPIRFLLSSFSIPLSLGAMSVQGKRVTIVG